MVLFPAEQLILAFSALLFAIDGTLMWSRGIAFDPDYFLPPLFLGGGLLALGQVMRRFAVADRFAHVIHLLALVQIFKVSCTAFNHLIAPLPGSMIDPYLVEADALLGYSWPQWVAWISQYPDLNTVVRQMYKLTLAQMVLAFIVVGLWSETARLHTCMLAAAMGAFMVVVCWGILPSGGAAAYWALDPALQADVGLVVDTAHGIEINRLVSEGMTRFPSSNEPGLVGFPSFHTVMALLSLAAIWPWRRLRLAVIASWSLLAPGILIHGGHNLLDLAGGAAVTLVAWRAAVSIMRRFETRPSAALDLAR